MSGKIKKVTNSLIDGISGIFMPIVNLLSAAGILKGILAVLTAASIVSMESETYLVLNAMADCVFYFLPVFLAATAAKKFGANPYTCMAIAGIVLYPSLASVLESGTTVHFLGIPLKGVAYHSSVLPMILVAAVLPYMEKFLDRILPDVIKGFLSPMISIIAVGTVTLFAFGPVSAVVGDKLTIGYEFVYHLSPAVAGLLLGAVVQWFVIFGLHWSFLLIAMNNIIVTGHDTVLALMAPAVFAQMGAALGVMVRSRNKAFKSICASAALTALMGTTEPAMFSVNLPRKKPMLAVSIGGAVGGCLAGISGAQAMSFAFPNVITLPVFLGEGFVLFVVGCVAATVVAFVLALVMKYDVDLNEMETTDKE